MRILLGTATFYPDANGVSTFLQQLALGLKKRGHHVFVVGPSTNRKDERRDYKGVPVFGVRSIRFPMNKQFRFCVTPLLHMLIEKEVERFRPDVIHVQDPFTINMALTRIAKKQGIPLVATHHTDVSMYEEYYKKVIPKSLMGLVRDWEWMFLCWYFSLMSAVTAPTAAAAAPLKEYGLQQRVRIISNGIDVARYASFKRNEKILRRFGIPEKKILLTVGRIDPEKRINVILRALVLARRSTDIHLIIVGKGKEEKRLRNMVKKLRIENAVTFTGFIPNADLPELYAACDCFVIAGISETQGIVTMEAMAAGLPVIAADALALPELVENGKNGFLFPPGDEDTVAACIKTVFQDEKRRKKMGQESLRLIRKHDIDHTVDAFETLYATLIKRK